MRMKHFLILSITGALLSSAATSYALTDSEKTGALAATRIVRAADANRPIAKVDIDLYTQYRDLCVPRIQQQADAALAKQGIKLPVKATKITPDISSAEELKRIKDRQDELKRIMDAPEENWPAPSTTVKPRLPISIPKNLTPDLQDLIKEAIDFIKTAKIFDLLVKLDLIENKIAEFYNMPNPDTKTIEVFNYIIEKLTEKMTEKTSKPETLSQEDKLYIKIFKLLESELIDMYISTGAYVEKNKASADPKIKSEVEKQKKLQKLVEDVIRAKGLAERTSIEVDKVNALPNQPKIQSPAKPKEGEPGFIGPKRPPVNPSVQQPAKPKEGEPGFIGPKRPPVNPSAQQEKKTDIDLIKNEFKKVDPNFIKKAQEEAKKEKEESSDPATDW